MQKSNEVYKITNKITNKVYIGITNQGSGVRYQKHWSDARHGDPCPIHLSMMKFRKITLQEYNQRVTRFAA